MELILIRHGESVANRERRIQGQSDYPLSQQGIEQVQRLAQWLSAERIDHIYSSDLSRAYQTALAIAKYHHLKVKVRTDVREVKLGRFETLTYPEIRERHPAYAGLDLLTSGLDDVEQVDQVYRRALAVTADLWRQHDGQRVILVSHGLFLSCLLQALLKVKWQGKRHFVMHNTGITTIKFESLERFMIVGMNEKPHLWQLQAD